MLVLGTIFVCANGRVSFAQRPIPIRKRAVDRLLIHDGPTLLGAIVARDAAGNVTMAVRREWLKNAAGAFYRQQQKVEQSKRHSDLRTLLSRIHSWRKERSDQKDLLPFLDQELKRVEQQIRMREKKMASKPTELMLITLPKQQIRGLVFQPATHRFVAQLAWKHRLKNVESRSAAGLFAELKRQNINTTPRPIDLSDRLPKFPESEQRWAARKAIVEYDALKRVRFQGTKDVLFRAGGDAVKQPQVMQLFSGLLNRQLSDLLDEALGNSRARKNRSKEALRKAIQTAEKEQVKGFRVTTVHPDINSQQVSVEESFYAKMPGGNWQLVWRFRSTIDATKKQPDLEKRIAQDENVKQATQLVKLLGLPAGQDAVTKAIRFGAATQLAQQQADNAFHKFRSRAVKRLDEPLWQPVQKTK